MGDTTISNQRPISAKGNENDVQVNDGSGDLKSITGLKVSRTGFLSATGFIGDGGLLSNVGGGSGVPGGSVNSIQYNAGASTFGGSSNFTFDGTNVSLSGGGMFSGDGGLLSNVGVQPGTVTQLGYYSGSTKISNTEGITYSAADNSLSISGNLVVGNTVKAVGGYFSERLTIGSSVLNATTNLYVTGNLYADRLYGDGSNLTGISGGNQTLAQVVARGNVTSNTVQFSNATTALTVTSVNSAIAFASNVCISGIDKVSIGFASGQTGTGIRTVAIGFWAGQTTQGGGAVAIGSSAARSNQEASAVAIGEGSGSNSQKFGAVSIGRQCGTFSQGSYAICIGTESGSNAQNNYAVAIGLASGSNYQGSSAIAIGWQAGNFTQNGYATAIGYQAGLSNQGSYSVAIGNLAGSAGQNTNSVAIGTSAGQTAQDVSTVAIGNLAGSNNQGSTSVAIGVNAGQSTQGSRSVAIGGNAGQTSQGSAAVSIGTNTGQTSQGSAAVAIGNAAGSNAQKLGAVAIGKGAGQVLQASYAVAIGFEAGMTSQNTSAVAIGNSAGLTSQGVNAVAVGNSAGSNRQGSYSVAIGPNAGSQTQNIFAVAIGSSAGCNVQGSYAVAIGTNAGSQAQNAFSTAIGYDAGQSNQGSYAIAIGNQAASTNQHANSILLNATDLETNTLTSNAFYVNPVRLATSSNVMFYNVVSKEVSYGTPIGTLQMVVDNGNTTSNTVQFTGASALHFVNNVNVSVGSANGSLAIGYNQAISNVGATYITPIRNTDVFTSNVLSYTQQKELVENDNIVISTNQVCIGNRTFVNLHTVSCNHGATTNVAVFNFAAPHVGIIKADALMVENSNTSTRHMEWLCKNIGGTQVFNTIQAYGSNTSPYGITNINMYPEKDDTSADNQKFTVGIELMGTQDGASDVTLSLETVGYAKPYIQLSRII